jgi:transcriptional regulator with XRE-family HTH domain
MSKPLAETVPLLLRLEMVRQDMTTTELARRLGVSQMWIHRRLRGHTEISLADLERLAGELNLRPNVVLEPAA